jgi:hypothetical protein
MHLPNEGIGGRADRTALRGKKLDDRNGRGLTSRRTFRLMSCSQRGPIENGDSETANTLRSCMMYLQLDGSSLT